MEESFLQPVVACACQAREVEEHGCWFGGRGGARDEHVEVHFAVADFGLVGEFEHFAPEVVDCGVGFERHFGEESECWAEE